LHAFVREEGVFHHHCFGFDSAGDDGAGWWWGSFGGLDGEGYGLLQVVMARAWMNYKLECSVSF
jgi:hypothetical protein